MPIWIEKTDIKSMREKPMNYRSRMLKTVPRFSSKGTKRDYDWIQSNCKGSSINFADKMKDLKQHLSQIEK